ncbi:helix-turn-helix transcriptional regulator [Amycolatopsis minnesotensis]|uniref:Helix-turn-helix transcriptional regulator n=1 Tax=Amycolatopsis minnesotensis TaxID=337894 RepID=A0ABN2SCP2_9PSEU
MPTVPRLFLGEALRRLRAESGKTLDEAAAATGRNRIQLIRVIDGKGTITADELEQLLDFFGATPKQKRELLALGVEARKRASRRPYTDLLPGAYERFTDLESMASEIWRYEVGEIPALLQIPEYIEAQMMMADGVWWQSSWEERRNRITFRLERQKLVMEAEQPKAIRFIITDDALRTPIGGTGIMTRQLEHILRVIDEHPNVTVQVLSATEPQNPARSGGLILLHFGELLRPVGFLPVVYGPSTYFDEPEDTGPLMRVFGKLEGLALSPDESRRLVADLVKGRAT